MAQAKPAQEPANRRAVHENTLVGQLKAQLVQRQFAVLCKPLAHPRAMVLQFAGRPTMTLGAWPTQNPSAASGSSYC